MRTILVAVGLTRDAPPAVNFAAEMARSLRAEIILCHVIDTVPPLLRIPVPQRGDVRTAAMDRLAELAAGMGCANVRSIVESGYPAERIVECAARERADEIVIGSHRHSAAARLLLGTVADRVAHTAKRSLERWVASFPARGVRVDARVLEGGPARSIIEEALRFHADLVVVGATHGSRLRRALLGDVAYAVAATSPVSVLVVRERRRTAPSR